MIENIVLLHGWGMNQGVFGKLRDELAQATKANILTLDLPGFGDSQDLPEPYQLEQVSLMLQQQLPSSCHLVAWSLSGLLSIDLASRFPEQIKGLTLLASSPYFCQSEPNWPGIKPDVLEGFMTSLSQSPQQTVERFLAIQAMGSEHARQDIKEIKQLLARYSQPNPIALEGGLELLKTVDLRDKFAQLQLPVSGIFGKLDALVPARAVKKMQQLNPQFNAKVINKASHAPFISHKQEFITCLCELLETN